MNPKDPKKSEREELLQTLKRIQSQTSQQKKKRAIDILTAKQKPKPNFQFSFLNVWKESLKKKALYVQNQARNNQNKHIVVVTAFFLVSTYIAWKIQSRFDEMRRKATVTQTYKQQMVQKQNQHINRMLRKKQFESVPIPDELEERTTYRFQKTTSDYGFDTKDDLLEAMAAEYKKGASLDLNYQEQLRSRNMI